MKKIIILENNGGRLANQLWLYANIYAYCLERGFELENYTFFRYARYFNTPLPKNWLVRNILFRFHRLHRSPKLGKLLHLLFVRYFKPSVVSHNFESENLSNLPPSKHNLDFSLIARLDDESESVAYICGWNFRNPAGLVKYHKQITGLLMPNDKVVEKVNNFLASHRKSNKYLVGVHIRQGDYKVFADGIYYYTFIEVRSILDNFLASQKGRKDILFIVCSDSVIDKDAFTGLNYVEGIGEPIADLYTLTKLDLLINSTSTFSQWASYFGQVRSVDFSREKIDWPFDAFSEYEQRSLTEWERDGAQT